MDGIRAQSFKKWCENTCGLRERATTRLSERQCLDVGQGMAAAYHQGVIAANAHHGWPVMVQQDT